ncbi:hypothetical protein ABZ388_25900 [Micromonospora parva]|uniref:hypothetical protein n=1 Tax=Micromonospora parva TaxID=1464048 RepID=UPI0033E36304
MVLLRGAAARLVAFAALAGVATLLGLVASFGLVALVLAAFVGLAARLRGAGVVGITSAGGSAALRAAALRVGVVRAFGGAGSSPLDGPG